MRGYDFTYDKLNRLVSASYGETGSLQTNTNRYSTSYTYDKNGNFLTLTRRGLQDGGSYGLIPPNIPGAAKTACQWMLGNVANSLYASFADLRAGTLDLSECKVIWWHYHVDVGSMWASLI